MTVLLELLTALSEYLRRSFYGIMQSIDFLAAKALLSPQNASIIPDSYTYLLCLKLCRHNHCMPIDVRRALVSCLSSYKVIVIINPMSLSPDDKV